MAGKPPTADEVPEKERGGLGLEIYKGNDWVDVTDKEEVESLLRSEEGNDTDEPNEPDLDMEFEAEEEEVDDPGVPESSASEGTSTVSSETQSNRTKQKKGKKGAKSDADPDERAVSSLMEELQLNHQLKFMENFNPKTSERVRRKKKKVQYFSSTGRTKNQAQPYFHGADGSIVGSGKNLCDCLQSDCPGCHYPCPKCGSGKCGTECRINRKWYYEKVEVEGTKLTWTNEFIKRK